VQSVRHAAVGAALMLLLATACNNTTDHGPADGAPARAGIKGVTNVDVGCSLTRRPSPCPRLPLPARLRILRQDRTAPEVQTQSGSDGAFAVDLHPGRYHVVPENLTGSPYPRAAPLTVEVPKGTFTEITIPFDSGVR